jgi:tetratricopeptide (TPR) repeat protein
LKKREIIILLSSCLLFISCQQKNKKEIIRHKEELIKTESLYFPDASIVDNVKKSNEYHEMLYSLYKNEKFELLEKHVHNYNKLAFTSETINGITNTYLGYILNQRSSLDSAQICFETAIKILNQKGNTRELYLAYSGNAINFSSKQEYDRAIKMHYKAIETLQKSIIKEKEKLYYGEITNLSFTFFYTQNYTKAISLLNDALEYSKKTNNVKNIAMLESAKSVMLYSEKKYDESIIFSKHSLELRIQLKDISGQAESNNNIALSYIGKEKWQEALAFLKKAKILYQEASDDSQSITIQQNIGKCLLNINKIDEAILIYDKTYRLASQKNKLNEKRIALKNLSKLYQMKGNYVKSLDLHTQFSNIKDTIYNIEKEKIIQEVSVKYETKQKEERIISLQKDKQIANIQISLILSILTIVGIVLFFFILRNRKNKELIVSKQKLHQSEIDRFNAEIRLSENELNNFAYKLLTKSKLIDELEGKLNTISSDKSETLGAQQISQLSQMKILTDEDWIQFKEHFDKAYPGFIPFIRKKHNNLTPAELRLLLLIKLNIETDEVASIIGISQESVRKGRYRLKKKLNLLEEEDLIQYVQNIVF